MKKYKVNEIFYSLQGEGYHTGRAAVFLRFSVCNRRCEFCDTDFAAFTEMTADEIVREVSQYPARHLVATGGEPLLQLDRPLIKALKAAGFYIQVETNGSLPDPGGIDWVTCSPKDGPWLLDECMELKVVYRGQDVEPLIKRFDPAVQYLQPCSCQNTAQVVQYILDHPHWRLSLQTHKLADFK